RPRALQEDPRALRGGARPARFGRGVAGATNRARSGNPGQWQQRAAAGSIAGEAAGGIALRIAVSGGDFCLFKNPDSGEPMNALVRKEIRLILPAWAAALVLAVAPVWFIPVNDLVGWQYQGTAMACYAFAFGAILLGVAPYGQECGLGTFSLLLAQPVSRRRIWRVKMVVAAGALVLVLTALAVSYRIRIQELPSREVVWNVLLICGMFA